MLWPHLCSQVQLPAGWEDTWEGTWAPCSHGPLVPEVTPDGSPHHPPPLLGLTVPALLPRPGRWTQVTIKSWLFQHSCEPSQRVVREIIRGVLFRVVA